MHWNGAQLTERAQSEPAVSGGVSLECADRSPVAWHWNYFQVRNFVF